MQSMETTNQDMALSGRDRPEREQKETPGLVWARLAGRGSE